jgi:predicted metal-binding transcription factor (methanogenesis marker protein 9)
MTCPCEKGKPCEVYKKMVNKEASVPEYVKHVKDVVDRTMKGKMRDYSPFGKA